MDQLLVNNSTSGLEHVQRGAFYVLFGKLNGYMDRVSAAWHEPDMKFAEFTEREYVETVLDHIAPDNFHEGHRPSLISAPVTEYPNCSVMVPRSAKGQGSDLLDHGSVSSMTLIIELMAHTLEGVDLSVTSRKAHRMAEACEQCIADNSTLGGMITEISGPPTVSVTSVFKRDEKRGRGQGFNWQGARLEFPLRKDTAFRNAGSGAFFNPTSASADNIGVDQV